MLVLTIVKEKMYVGNFDGGVDALDDAITGIKGGIKLTESLEIREMFVPTDGGQIHRMVNFVTISPFDKNPHNLTLKNITGYIVVEANSDTFRGYENFLTHLRAESANIQLPGSPNFSGKFGPLK